MTTDLTSFDLFFALSVDSYQFELESIRIIFTSNCFTYILLIVPSSL